MTYKNYDYVVDQLNGAGLELEMPLDLARVDKSVRCLVVGGDHHARRLV